MSRSLFISIFVWALFCPMLYGQQFEIIKAGVMIRGVAEHGERMVVYGAGLTWIARSGEIESSLQLIEGFPISDVRKVVEDGRGGIWVMTPNGVGHVDGQGKGRKVFSNDAFDAQDVKDMKVKPDGILLVLLKNEIVSVASDFSFSSYYKSPNANDIGFFQGFDFDSAGNIYIISFFKGYIISPAKEIKAFDPNRRNLSFQKVEVTRDGKIMVLEYQRIYELQGTELVTVLNAARLSDGAQFYDAVFTDSDDYWLYANQANAFHFHRGTWKNFIPPKGWKTGNLGECMIRTKNGEIWMSLSFHNEILRYDGTRWYRITIKEKDPLQVVQQMRLFPGGEIIAIESGKGHYMKYNGDDFIPIPGLPATRIINFQKDIDGEYVFSTEEGIFKKSGSNILPLLKSTGIKSFVRMDQDILYTVEDQIIFYSKQKKDTIRHNTHFLGWDDIGNVTLYKGHDGKVFCIAARRPGQLSMFDGKAWSKMTQLEGIMIGSIDNVLRFDDFTLIVNKKGSVIRYDGQGFRWLYHGRDSKEEIKNPILSADGSLWYMVNDHTVQCISPLGEAQTFDMPVVKFLSRLGGVIWKGDRVYDFYVGDTVARLNMDRQPGE